MMRKKEKVLYVKSNIQIILIQELKDSRREREQKRKGAEERQQKRKGAEERQQKTVVCCLLSSSFCLFCKKKKKI